MTENNFDRLGSDPEKDKLFEQLEEAVAELREAAELGNKDELALNEISSRIDELNKKIKGLGNYVPKTSL